ncbi:MAG TPA: hypothetical protein VK427_01055 [Kofleriaceae bacterium]|nr:hypothetical protein [Kofleriaceae bacterium]
MKKRTKIENISAVGFELADTQLRQVSGGAGTRPRKCWQPSGSMVEPGETDPQQDYVVD